MVSLLMEMERTSHLNDFALSSLTPLQNKRRKRSHLFPVGIIEVVDVHSPVEVVVLVLRGVKQQQPQQQQQQQKGQRKHFSRGTRRVQHLHDSSSHTRLEKKYRHIGSRDAHLGAPRRRMFFVTFRGKGPCSVSGYSYRWCRSVGITWNILAVQSVYFFLTFFPLAFNASTLTQFCRSTCENNTEREAGRARREREKRIERQIKRHSSSPGHSTFPAPLAAHRNLVQGSWCKQ